MKINDTDILVMRIRPRTFEPAVLMKSKSFVESENMKHIV